MGPAWGRLGNGDEVTPDRRRIRVLSQGSKQLLGLRTVLSRQPLQLVVLDECFAALDPASLRATLDCVSKRAPALLVVAHP